MVNKKLIKVYDTTLRNGNHTLLHRKLSLEMIRKYCSAIDTCGVQIVEVGHGNGLWLSSMHLNFYKFLDLEMLEAARNNLLITKLSVQIIPSFATLNAIQIAANAHVDVVRIATNYNETYLSEKYIAYAREKGMYVHGALMMSHIATSEVLLEQANKMKSYGAQALIVMDSSGDYLEADVLQKISLLVTELNIPVGFYAHNNLGLAISNSIAAIRAGAEIIDGALGGIDIGVSNTHLEILMPAITKTGYETSVNFIKLLEASEKMQLEQCARK